DRLTGFLAGHGCKMHLPAVLAGRQDAADAVRWFRHGYALRRSLLGSQSGSSFWTIAEKRLPNISTSIPVPGTARSARSMPSAIDLSTRWPKPPDVVSPTIFPSCQSVDM